MSDIQSIVDSLTARGCTVQITQYAGGVVDVMLISRNGALTCTERYIHESIDDALDFVLKQYDEMERLSERLAQGPLA